MIKAYYVDHMGDDLRVVNAARISFNKKKDKFNKKDEKLTNYLAKHKHLTPFEHCILSVEIHCPLYIRSQIHRHRTFSYNEQSRRYTAENIEFYEPVIYRKQHDKSKQCSDGDLSDKENTIAQVKTQFIHNKCLSTYNELLDLGVSRELARGILPQNLMTKFLMTGNLRNWIHFLKLRLDEHAQEEVQWLAQDIEKIIKDKFEISGKVLMEN